MAPPVPVSNGNLLTPAFEGFFYIDFCSISVPATTSSRVDGRTHGKTTTMFFFGLDDERKQREREHPSVVVGSYVGPARLPLPKENHPSPSLTGSRSSPPTLEHHPGLYKLPLALDPPLLVICFCPPRLRRKANPTAAYYFPACTIHSTIDY